MTAVILGPKIFSELVFRQLRIVNAELSISFEVDVPTEKVGGSLLF